LLFLFYTGAFFCSANKHAEVIAPPESGRGISWGRLPKKLPSRQIPTQASINQLGSLPLKSVEFVSPRLTPAQIEQIDVCARG
jgi:hypothetical protein